MMNENPKVYLKIYKKQEGEDEAVVDVVIGDAVMTIRGKPQMVHDATAGFTHLFFMEVCPEGSEYDFVGEIRRDKNGDMPYAKVELGRLVSPATRQLYSSILVVVGHQGMKYGVDYWDTAVGMAKGIADMLGLPQKDKKGKVHAGRISVHLDDESQ